MSYSDFKMLQKEEKYEENKTNFEGAYLENGLVNSAQICNWRCPAPRKFAQKILCVSAQGVFELQMRENTLVCPTPKVSFFLGRTTLLCVLISPKHVHQ